MLRALAIILTLLSIFSTSSAIADEGYTVPLTYDRLTYPCPTLNVSINSSRAYTFVLDTGLNAPVVIEEWAAKELKLADGDGTNLKGVNSGPAVELILLGGAEGKNLHMKGTPCLINHTPAPESKLVGGPRIAGTLGLPVLLLGAAKLNFAAQQLTLYLEPAMTMKSPTVSTISAEYDENAAYIYVDGTGASGRRRVKMLLDTGSNHTILPVRLAGEMGGEPLATDCSVQFDGTLVLGPVIKLNKLRIGDFDEMNVSAELRPRDGKLGMDVLERFILTFDYPHRTVLMERAPNYAKLIRPQADAGLNTTFKNGIHAVSAVRKDSGAGLAGVKPGDRILSVNGKRVDSVSYYALQEMLGGDRGKSIVLTVSRGAKTLPSIKVVLKEYLAGTVLAGASLTKPQNGPLSAAYVLESGPAWKAGMREHDIVINANGRKIESFSLEELANVFDQTSVSLTVKPAGSESIKRVILNATPVQQQQISPTSLQDTKKGAPRTAN